MGRNLSQPDTKKLGKKYKEKVFKLSDQEVWLLLFHFVIGKDRPCNPDNKNMSNQDQVVPLRVNYNI
jgi:hypothetical protein